MDSGEKNEIQFWKEVELCATFISKSDLNVLQNNKCTPWC